MTDKKSASGRVEGSTLVQVTLDRSQPKVRSVRYDAPSGDKLAVLQTVYLSNEAADRLGQPDRILVTIEAAG